MAGAFDQAKMKFSKIVNSRSYTRFNQSPNPDGEGSHVEVKLSVEGEEEEEVDSTEQGHVQRDVYMKSSHSSRSLNKKRILVCIGVILVVFFVGLLIGYSIHRKSELPSCSSAHSVTQNVQPTQKGQPAEDVPPIYDSSAPSMDWSDVVNLLNKTLSSKAIEENLRVYAQKDRTPGSPVDNQLGDKIHDTFTQLGMNPWVDEHYVKLQYPDSSNPNKVLFGSEEIGSPKGFLAYSETGRKEGRVVNGIYGELADLQTVSRQLGNNLNGSVVLMKTGKISIAQKVMNAAQMGAVGALIYPDQADDKMSDTELYGHVHLGSGDPYTPGFPSFNHTQFPPAKSSGLPGILAQTITYNMARKILEKMKGNNFGSESDKVTVVVNNKLADTKIHNVFGVIEGYVDPDRYVVIGAQRDTVTSGYAKSAVGTSLLMELARVFTEMKKNGLKPKRSIVFASWTAGDFGNVGLTEWLEGYWSSLDRKAFTYISLDGLVTGTGSFKASASPLLHTLLQRTLKKVQTFESNSKFLQNYDFSWTKILKPMQMDDGAYPFLAFSGIPSVSFSFVSSQTDYKYFGTDKDDKNELDEVTNNKVVELSMVAAQIAGQMALRLVHDHFLKLDITTYGNVITDHVIRIIRLVNNLKREKVIKTESLSTDWLNTAKSSFARAADALANDIKNSDLDNIEMCRIINNRIMRVEHNLLSPYVSLRDVPFRHIFFGNGWQTTTDLEKYLDDVYANKTGFDINQVLNKFALLTWNIQGAANDLAGDIWSLDNEI